MFTSVPRPIKSLIRKLFPKRLIESLIQIECTIARRWAYSAHRQLMFVQWYFPPQSEHFDHHIDLYYQWLSSRNPMWLERGIFGCLALKRGKVLELACGDGFNARNFYSVRSQRVIGCDFDPGAIHTARQKNSANNVEFVLADIRTNMPDGKFENIMWDAAIEHFTSDEITQIMKNIKLRLADNGILSGYTIVEKADGTKSLSYHEYEFKSKEDLQRFLLPHFKNVKVFETITPDRHNLYFWASDGVLPFDAEWPNLVQSVNVTA